jgi:hypothetical protein
MSLDRSFLSIDDHPVPANVMSSSLVSGRLCQVAMAGEDDPGYSPALSSLRVGRMVEQTGGEIWGMSRMHVDDRACLACRATVLSRYNPDPLCSVCQRASRDTTGIVPTWLWDSEPMRAALVRVDIPAVIAIFRAASGLSQMELGNLVEGWSQSLVSLTERGLRDTLYDIRKLLAFADAVGMRRAALLPLILGRPDAILDDDNDVALWEVDTGGMDRRGFTTLAGGFVVLADPDGQFVVGL